LPPTGCGSRTTLLTASLGSAFSAKHPYRTYLRTDVNQALASVRYAGTERTPVPTSILVLGGTEVLYSKTQSEAYNERTKNEGTQRFTGMERKTLRENRSLLAFFPSPQRGSDRIDKARATVFNCSPLTGNRFLNRYVAAGRNGLSLKTAWSGLCGDS